MILVTLVKEKGKRRGLPTKNHYEVQGHDFQTCDRIEDLFHLKNLPVGSKIILRIWEVIVEENNV